MRTLLEKAKLKDMVEFNRRFNELKREHPDKTYVEIYFMVEEEHISVFQETKYSSYESFRVVRSRHMQKVLNNR